MGPDIVLGEHRKGIVAGVDIMAYTRIERLPGFVYRGPAQGRLKCFKTPVLVVEPCSRIRLRIEFLRWKFVHGLFLGIQWKGVGAEGHQGDPGSVETALLIGQF